MTTPANSKPYNYTAYNLSNTTISASARGDTTPPILCSVF